MKANLNIKIYRADEFKNGMAERWDFVVFDVSVIDYLCSYNAGSKQNEKAPWL